MLIQSGIGLVDERLGGIQARRLYVLTGAPGTGKTAACLEFLHGGFIAGERTALLTVDDPGDLIAQGEFLGIDLERAVRDDRLVLVRYQLDFARRFSRAVSPETAFDELARLLGEPAPTRIVIDSIAPFLEAGQASGAGLVAALALVERLRATSFITLPGDLAGMYDRRLEHLVQRAAAILHLSVLPDRTGQMDLRKVRYQVPSTAPIHFQIQPGKGLTSIGELPRRRSEDVPDSTRRRVLVLNLTAAVSSEHIAALQAQFDVTVREGLSSAIAQLTQMSGGAIVIDVRRDLVDDTLTLVRELRRAGNRAPILLMTSYRLRATDRARSLRAGADGFLPGDASPDELVLRVENLVRMGRSTAAPVADTEVPLAVQPQVAEGYEPLDGDAFRQAVQAHVSGDRIPFFTIVSIRSHDGDAKAISDIALRNTRIEGGDLTGVDDEGVKIYLHSARRKDVAPFVERVRGEWRHTGRGELEIETLTYPADEARMRALFGVRAAT